MIEVHYPGYIIGINENQDTITLRITCKIDKYETGEFFIPWPKSEPRPKLNDHITVGLLVVVQ